MGYRCRFLDNEEYGADDITAVFSQLIGGGVLAYPENVTVAQALDELTAETVGAGVSEYGGLQVSVSDDGILIGQGAAFFDSGVSVEVDSEGILLEYEPGTQVYVSLIYEADFNHVLPSVTTDRRRAMRCFWHVSMQTARFTTCEAMHRQRAESIPQMYITISASLYRDLKRHSAATALKHNIICRIQALNFYFYGMFTVRI